MSTQMKIEDFEKIYQETYDSTLKFIVVKSRSFDNVNDLLQDTYVELYRILSRKNILEIDNIQAFVIGIANNVMKRFYRNKKRNPLQLLKSDEETTIDIKDDFDLEQNFITKENVREIWNEIKSKNIVIAKIFYFYFVWDLKLSEIANILNLNESTVKTKLYRTLNQMREIYGKEEKKNEK